MRVAERLGCVWLSKWPSVRALKGFGKTNASAGALPPKTGFFEGSSEVGLSPYSFPIRFALSVCFGSCCATGSAILSDFLLLLMAVMRVSFNLYHSKRQRI